MKRVVLLALLAAAGVAAPAVGQDAAAPTYQRQRVAPAPHAVPRGRRSWRPQAYAQPRFDRRGPQVAAGTFQRPYPYHLDYYKQKFGGGYDPYFGNLYGPPNVVLAPGLGYGVNAGYGVVPAPVQPQAGVAPGLCPHCGQPFPATQPAPVTSPAVTGP